MRENRNDDNLSHKLRSEKTKNRLTSLLIMRYSQKNVRVTLYMMTRKKAKGTII
jgi:hypothetical protein